MSKGGEFSFVGVTAMKNGIQMELFRKLLEKKNRKFKRQVGIVEEEVKSEIVMDLGTVKLWDV